MLPAEPLSWEISDMADADDLRGLTLYHALMRLKPNGLAETDWAASAGVNRGFFTNLKSSDISPRSDTLSKLLKHIGRTNADLHNPGPIRQWGGNNPQADIIADEIEMVGIKHSDAAFGLGAVFTDERPEVEVLQFPKIWVETITHSSPAHLSWVRARGSSMAPTINDGDMILLDHSERRVRDQDELWAFTVGEARGIKRLRVKGDRFQILSDNPNVPPDEEPIDFVNIVARVVFVGRRT